MGQTKSKRASEWRRLSESDCLALLSETEQRYNSQRGSITAVSDAGHVPPSVPTSLTMASHLQGNQLQLPNHTMMRTRDDFFLRPPSSGLYVPGHRFSSYDRPVHHRPLSVLNTSSTLNDVQGPLITFDEDEENLEVDTLSNRSHPAPMTPIYAQIQKNPRSGAVQLRRQSHVMPMTSSPQSVVQSNTRPLYNRASYANARRSMYPLSPTAVANSHFHLEPPPPSRTRVGGGGTRRVQGPRPMSMLYPTSATIMTPTAVSTISASSVTSAGTKRRQKSYAEMLEECNTLEHCACDEVGCLDEEDDNGEVFTVQTPGAINGVEDDDVEEGEPTAELASHQETSDGTVIVGSSSCVSDVPSQETAMKKSLSAAPGESSTNLDTSVECGFLVDLSTPPLDSSQAPPTLVTVRRRHCLTTGEVNELTGRHEQTDQQLSCGYNTAPASEDDSNISQEPEVDQSRRTEAAKNDVAGGPIRCSGLECLCDRCIAHRFKLLNWLLPNCTRINAERLLQGRPNGTFLVRKSEKFPGQFTLSFVCRRSVRHCLIMRSVYGFGLRWPYSFETLQQVIIHYVRTSLVEFNSKLDTRLRYPVFMA